MLRLTWSYRLNWAALARRLAHPQSLHRPTEKPGARNPSRAVPNLDTRAIIVLFTPPPMRLSITDPTDAPSAAQGCRQICRPRLSTARQGIAQQCPERGRVRRDRASASCAFCTSTSPHGRLLPAVPDRCKRRSATSRHWLAVWAPAARSGFVSENLSGGFLCPAGRDA